MSQPVLVVAIFLSVMIFVMGVLYLLFAPAKNRAALTRLEVIRARAREMAYGSQGSEKEISLLHRDVLSHLPVLDRFLSNFPAAVRLNAFIQQAGMSISVGKMLTLIGLIFVGICAVGFLMQRNMVIVLLAALFAAAIPIAVTAVRRMIRFSKFEEQFPEAIDLMSRAVRAGHAFTTGFELIGRELPEPVAGEFRLTYEQQNLGLPVKEAFQNLLVRVPLEDVHVFVTALNIQRESGGNLAEILDNLSKIIRERFKLKKQIKVYTAQGRITLYILSAVAPCMLVFFSFSNPDYMAPLFDTVQGVKMIVAAAALQLMGFFTISRIVRPKI